MIETFRSYQVLLITQSQFRNSRTSAAESRPSTAVGAARSSCCAFANPFAFARLRPAIPTRLTSRADRRSGTVDWAMAPYPPRIRMSKAPPSSRKPGRHLPFSQPHPSGNRAAARSPEPARTSATLTPNAGPYPTTHAGIGDNRGRLARDVDGKNLGASHSVDLRQKDREEPVERGETTEQKEDADQIDPEGSRESHPGAMSGRRDEVENPHRKKAPLLDA